MRSGYAIYKTEIGSKLFSKKMIFFLLNGCAPGRKCYINNMRRDTKKGARTMTMDLTKTKSRLEELRIKEEQTIEAIEAAEADRDWDLEDQLHEELDKILAEIRDAEEEVRRPYRMHG